MPGTRTLVLTSLMALLTLAAACADSSAPATPAAPTGAVLTANSDGSTVKITPPVPTAPANNSTFAQGVTSAQLQATAATAQFSSTPTLSYRFEVYKGSSIAGSPVATLFATPSNSVVSVTTGSLDLVTPYAWRVRAESGGAGGPWSATQGFTTGQVPPQPRRDANAFGGQVPRSLAIADLQSQLGPVTAAHNAEVQASCNNGRNVLDFPTVLLQALRRIDNRWGFNCRRGNCADPSNDAIAYHWGVGSSEQSIKVYIFDVIGGLDAVAGCKTQIIDVTDQTFAAGTVGRFSLLGRFPANNPDF